MFELKNVGKTLSIRFCKITPNTEENPNFIPEIFYIWLGTINDL